MKVLDLISSLEKAPLNPEGFSYLCKNLLDHPISRYIKVFRIFEKSENVSHKRQICALLILSLKYINKDNVKPFEAFFRKRMYKNSDLDHYSKKALVSDDTIYDKIISSPMFSISIKYLILKGSFSKETKNLKTHEIEGILREFALNPPVSLMFSSLKSLVRHYTSKKNVDYKLLGEVSSMLLKENMGNLLEPSLELSYIFFRKDIISKLDPEVIREYYELYKKRYHEFERSPNLRDEHSIAQMRNNLFTLKRLIQEDFAKRSDDLSRLDALLMD